MNPKLKEIADKIVQMRIFSKELGIQTNRSQGSLINGLDPVEVSLVAAEVNRQLFTLKTEERETNVHPAVKR